MEAEAPIDGLYQLIKEGKTEEVYDRPAYSLNITPYSEEDLATILEAYDIITKRERLKKTPGLPQGTRVLTKTRKKFQNFCESLTKDFKGVMRLYGKLDEKLYIAGLLLERGNIIAASFEEVDNKKIVFKEEAITQIKKKLYGTKGDLDVYAFNEADMKKARERNTEALLTSATPLLSIGMKIKSKVKTWAKKTTLKSLAGDEKPRITRLRTGEHFNLAGFAHKISDSLPSEKEDKSSELSENRLKFKKKQLQEKERKEISDLNKKGFNKTIRKRLKQDTTPEKKISKTPWKEYTKNTPDLGKIQTPIDRLYQLVQKHNRLKIDNRLVRELDVSESQLEGWAMILEKYNLVELRYSVIGKPEIRTINNKFD